MNYYDLFLRGGFVGLLVKYGVNVRKWAIGYHLILILMVFVGLVLLYLFHTYHVENKWRLLLTALAGLAGGWWLSLNLFRHLGVNKNAFLRKIYPMELTSSAIPTIVAIINKKMIWVYLFWLLLLGFVDSLYMRDYSSIYAYVFEYIFAYSFWISSSFLLVLYLCYKRIS